LLSKTIQKKQNKKFNEELKAKMLHCGK